MQENKLFSTASDVFEEQLNELFLRKDDKDLNIVLQALSLILYQNSNNTDLVELYHLLDLEGFVKVITLYEDRTVEFPSKDEIKESIILSLCFYYREIENKSWNEIRDTLPFEISSHSYASKIKNLNKFIKKKMKELFMED